MTTGEKQTIPACEHCKMKGHNADVCRQKNMVCYKCGKTGHKAFRCPESTKSSCDEKKDVKVCKTAPMCQSMIKKIMVNSVEVDALVDTGSDITIVQEDFFRKLNPAPKVIPSTLNLGGIGNQAVTPTGSAEICVTTEETDVGITIMCEIVGSEVSNVPVILGKDLLGQINVIIEKGTVKFEIPEEANNIFNIAADVLEDKIPTDVQTLIDNYKPNLNFQKDIQTSIVLKDDERVYHNPRRLPQAEKQVVDDQIARWLSDGIIKASTPEYASPILLVKKKGQYYATLC